MSFQILVVDDEPRLTLLYHTLLAHAGYTVTIHPGPVPALTDIQQVRPDLILLNYWRGNAETVALFLRHLRTDPATEPLPVVLCTERIPVVDWDPARIALHSCAVVYKPFAVETFLTTIAGQLREQPEPARLRQRARGGSSEWRVEP